MAVESQGGAYLILKQWLEEEALQQGLFFPTTHSCWRTLLGMVRHEDTPASAHLLTAAPLPQVLLLVHTNICLTP